MGIGAGRLVRGPVWCLRNDPNNSASWYWSQPNSATNAGSWPMSNYWVISPNNELAYSKVQSGPPSQSQPVNAGGLYSLSTASNYFYLGINNSGAGYHLADTPFLSFGAQMGRGVSGPIGWINPPDWTPTSSSRSASWRKALLPTITTSRSTSS